MQHSWILDVLQGLTAGTCRMQSAAMLNQAALLQLHEACASGCCWPLCNLFASPCMGSKSCKTRKSQTKLLTHYLGQRMLRSRFCRCAGVSEFVETLAYIICAEPGVQLCLTACTWQVEVKLYRQGLQQPVCELCRLKHRLQVSRAVVQQPGEAGLSGDHPY